MTYDPRDGFQAKVIAHSANACLHNKREIVTLQLRYPRFIHSEFMTHRMFSRNASSSRAIPVAKTIEQVCKEPAMPIHWGKNQPGMQAREELDAKHVKTVRRLWFNAAYSAAFYAEELMELGAHKQIVNRLLEPFQWISVVVTATEWDNFFELRDHEDAQPEIRFLAQMMHEAIIDSVPIYRGLSDANASAWHLPYVSQTERTQFPIEQLVAMSAARCARVSYLTHDGNKPDPAADIALHDRLVGSRPIHASPTEHQARTLSRDEFSKNFRGWQQYRCHVEGIVKMF
jgi:thymidylate synthase ThyX